MSHVRVVDDDRLIAEMLQALLTTHGHTAALTCEDFHSLLTPAPWAGVDAVLCDLTLPGPTSGVHILAWLHTHLPRIRRIVLSAQDLHADIHRQVEPHADVMLTKPAGIEQILAALK